MAKSPNHPITRGQDSLFLFSRPVLAWRAIAIVGHEFTSMNAGAMTQSATRYIVPPETVAETPGESAAFELGSLAGKLIVIVLRITGMIEQESLHISIWGSADGKDWGSQALFWFPQKFYRGVTPAALDLGKRPEIRFLQARWEVNRWGRGDPRPYFKFAIEIEATTPG